MYYNFRAVFAFFDRAVLGFSSYFVSFAFFLTLLSGLSFSFVAYCDVYMVNTYSANVYDAPSKSATAIITYFNRTLVYTVPATQQDYANLHKSYSKLKYEPYTDFMTNDGVDWVKIQINGGGFGWIAKNSVSYISSDTKKDKDIVWGEPNSEEMNKGYSDNQGTRREGSGGSGYDGQNNGQSNVNIKGSDVGNNHYNEKLSPVERLVDLISVYNIKSIKSDKVDFFSEYIAQIILSTVALIAIILALDYFKFYNIIINANWATRIADFVAGSMLVLGVAMALANGVTLIPFILVALSVLIFLISSILTNQNDRIAPAIISKPILWFGLISILYASIPLILIFGLIYYLTRTVAK